MWSFLLPIPNYFLSSSPSRTQPFWSTRHHLLISWVTSPHSLEILKTWFILLVIPFLLLSFLVTLSSMETIRPICWSLGFLSTHFQYFVFQSTSVIFPMVTPSPWSLITNALLKTSISYISHWLSQHSQQFYTSRISKLLTI